MIHHLTSNQSSGGDSRIAILCLSAAILAVGFFELGEQVGQDQGSKATQLACESSWPASKMEYDRAIQRALDHCTNFAPMYPAVAGITTPIANSSGYWSVEKNGKIISAGFCDGPNGKCRTTFRATNRQDTATIDPAGLQGTLPINNGGYGSGTP